MDPEESRKEMYSWLQGQGKVTESYEDFTEGYSSPKELLSLHYKLEKDGLIEQDYKSFKAEYFGDLYGVKKKETSPSEISSENSSSDLDAGSQETTKQPYKPEKDSDPIAENLKWLGADETMKDNLLVTEIDIAERKKNAKFSPGNIFPKSMLDAELKANEEYNEAIESLEKLKKQGTFGDNERLYAKTVEERLSGLESFLGDIEKDKKLYLKEKTNDRTKDKWLKFTGLDDQSNKTYSELYQKDNLKYDNYLNFGTYEGEEKKINKLDEKEEMYSSLSKDLSTLKSDKTSISSYREELRVQEREKLDNASFGLAGSFKIPYLPDNNVVKRYKEDKITQLLDEKNFESDSERAEFREFVLAKINSEERTEKLQVQVKSLAEDMGITLPENVSNDKYKEKLSSISLDFQAQTKNVVEQMKSAAAKSDRAYKSQRTAFVGAKRKEALELVSAFDKQLQKAYGDYKANGAQLQHALKSGQITEEQFDAENKKLFGAVQEIEESKKSELEKFNKESQTALKEQYELHLSQRKELLGNPTASLEKLSLIRDQAEAKALDLQKEYGVSDEDKSKLQEVYAIANAKMNAEQKIKRDLEWDKQGNFEKLGTSFRKGILGLFQSLGVATEYFAPGIDQVSFDITALENKILAEAQKDFGKFEWSQLMDKDFIIANVGEQLPIMMPLVGTAGMVTKGASVTLGRTALTARMKNALAATTGALSTRPIEGAMNAGSVLRAQLQEGKSFEDAYEKATEVFAYNQGLMVTDAIQNYLWFTKGGKMINTNSLATRTVQSVGTKAFGAGAEGFEEVYQGGVEKMATDSEYAQMGLLESVSKFAKTEEGRRSFGTGLLMGPIMDAYGFVTSERNDVARLNKQFRDYVKMTEQVAEIGAPTELGEKIALRDLQLREVFATLHARGDMSKEEFDEVTGKLNYQVEMMSKSTRGELPFAWDSDRFAAYSQFSYEAKKLREDADKLPKADKAGKDALKKRAEKLEKDLTSLMENPLESNTYSVDGTQVTEEEFRAILDSGNQDLIDMGSFRTSNVELIEEYMGKERWPKKETARSISNAEDMVIEAMGMSEEGVKYKTEQEAIDGLVAEKKERLEEIEKELADMSFAGSVKWNTLDKEKSDLKKGIADLGLFAKKSEEYKAVKEVKKESGKELLDKRDTSTKEEDSVTELENKLGGEIDVLSKDLDAAKKERLEAVGEETKALDEKIVEIESAIKKKEQDLSDLAVVGEKSPNVQKAPDFKSSVEIEAYYDDQIKELSQKERELIDTKSETESKADLEAITESKKKIEDAKAEAIKKLDGKKIPFKSREDATKYYDGILEGLSKKEAELLATKSEEEAKGELEKIRSDRTLMEEAKVAATSKDAIYEDDLKSDIEKKEKFEVQKFEDTDEEDTPLKEGQADRDRGYRVQYGKKISRRKAITSKITGKIRKVLFSRDQNDNPIELETEYTIIEADDLIPSHKATGNVNLEFFLNEAQPRPREKGATKEGGRRKGEKINPEELGGNYVAYTGAPVVNERGESIQGTGRSQGIKYYYKENNTGEYQAMLEREAEALGIDKDKLKTFTNPVLVRMAKSNDAEAVKFGQFKSKELEDADTPGEGEKARAKILDPQQYKNLKDTLRAISNEIKGLRSLTKIIRKGGKELIDAMVRNNLLRPNDVPSMFADQDLSKKLTDYGIFKIKSFLKGLYFKNSDPALSVIFEGLPYAVRDGIARSMVDILTADDKLGLVDTFDEVIFAIDELQSSNSDFGSWVNQLTFDGKTPKDSYSPEALQIVEHIVNSNDGNMMNSRDISKAISDLVGDTKQIEGFFKGEAMSKEDAINKNFSNGKNVQSSSKTGSAKENKKTSGKGKDGRSQSKGQQKTISRKERVDEHNSKKGNLIQPADITDAQKASHIEKNGMPNLNRLRVKLSKFSATILSGMAEKLFGKKAVRARVVYSKTRSNNKLSGFFDKKDWNITVDNGQIDLLVHELSHWLDFANDIEGNIPYEIYKTISSFSELGSKPDPEEMKELTIKLLKEDGINKPTEEQIASRIDGVTETYRRREAVAEFLSAMMVNRSAVENNYAAAQDYFLEALADGKNIDKKKVKEFLDDISMDFSVMEKLTATEMAIMMQEQGAVEKESLAKERSLIEKMNGLYKKFQQKYFGKSEGNLYDTGLIGLFNRLFSNKDFNLEQVFSSWAASGQANFDPDKNIDANFNRMKRLLMGTQTKLKAIFAYGVPTIIKDKDGNIGFEYNDGKQEGLSWVLDALMNVSSLTLRKKGKSKKDNLKLELESKGQQLAVYMTAQRTLEYANKFATENIKTKKDFENFQKFLIKNGRSDLAKDLALDIDFSNEGEALSKVRGRIFEMLGNLAKENKSSYMAVISKFGRIKDLTALNTNNLEKSDLESAFEILDEFNAYPEKTLEAYNEASRRYRDLANRVLKYQVDLGFLSQEKYDTIKKYNTQYIALHRMYEKELGVMSDEDYNKPFSAGESSVGAKHIDSIQKGVSSQKKAKGGSDVRMNAFDALYGVINASVKLADKNLVANSFFDLVDKMEGTFTASIVRPISEEEYKSGKVKNKNVVPVYKNGEQKYYEFNDKQIYDRFIELGEYMGQNSNKLMKGMTKMMSWFKAAQTKNPSFPIKDAMRQYQSYKAGVSKSRSGLPFVDLLKKRKDFWLSDEEAGWKFDMYGAGQSGSQHYFSSPMHYDSAMYYAIKQLSEKGKRQFFTGSRYSDYLQSFDQRQRLNEFRFAYQKYRKEGLSDIAASKLAALEARDLMDFSVRGELATQLDILLPFFNPAVRGLGKTKDVAKNLFFLEGENVKDRAKNAGKGWAKIALWGLLPSMLEKAIAEGGDYEEEHAKLPWWQRDMFYNIKIGGIWVCIPKSQELGIYSAIMNRMIEKHYYGRDIDMGSSAMMLAWSLSPLKIPTGGPALTLGVEVWANKSLFRKTDIDWDEGESDLELKRSNKETSNLAKFVEKTGGYNSVYVDYLLSSLTGDFGDIVRFASDMIPMDREVQSRGGYGLAATPFFRADSPFLNRDVIQIMDYENKENRFFRNSPVYKDYGKIKAELSEQKKILGRSKDEKEREKAEEIIAEKGMELKKEALKLAPITKKIEAKWQKYKEGEDITINGEVYNRNRVKKRKNGKATSDDLTDVYKKITKLI